MTGGAIRADHGAKTRQQIYAEWDDRPRRSDQYLGRDHAGGQYHRYALGERGQQHLVRGVSLGAFTLATGNTGPNTHGGSWSGQALTISGAISGTGGITQGSSGTLILSGANTYSGPTTVASGTLEVLNASTTTAVGVLGPGVS